jgi:hypothetical protein
MCFLLAGTTAAKALPPYLSFGGDLGSGRGDGK